VCERRRGAGWLRHRAETCSGKSENRMLGLSPEASQLEAHFSPRAKDLEVLLINFLSF
jgi:hypothetical protein